MLSSENNSVAICGRSKPTLTGLTWHERYMYCIWYMRPEGGSEECNFHPAWENEAILFQFSTCRINFDSHYNDYRLLQGFYNFYINNSRK